MLDSWGFLDKISEMKQGLKIHVSPVRFRLCPLPFNHQQMQQNQAKTADSDTPSASAPDEPTSANGSPTSAAKPCGCHCGADRFIIDLSKSPPDSPSYFGSWNIPTLTYGEVRSINSRRASDVCGNMGVLTQPPARPTIYLLIKNNGIVYVGKTMEVFARIASHPHRGRFDHVRFFFVRADEMDLIEAELICQLRPPLNRDIPISRLINMKTVRSPLPFPAEKGAQ